MKLKGNYNGGTSYNVGDVVLYTDDVVYHLQYPCPSGIPPTDTRYWSRTDQTIGHMVRFIMDALEIESGNNQDIEQDIPTNLSENALILKSSTEDSDKEFIITVDDEGELTATELTEESGE